MYYKYKKKEYSCSKCGWSGLGEQTELGEVFDALFEIVCPNCNKLLTSIPYPLLEEMLEHGSEEDKKAAEERQSFLERVKTSRLEIDDYLPEIDSDEIFIKLKEEKSDNEGDDDWYIVLYHDNKEIWREIRTYEYYNRYMTIGNILKKKYGVRLADFDESEASGYICGDSLSAIDYVERFRRSIIDNPDRFLYLAERGDAEAQYKLGNCYLFGGPYEQEYDEQESFETKIEDFDEAVLRFTKAAEQGHAKAQNTLGECYFYGWQEDKFETKDSNHSAGGSAEPGNENDIKRKDLEKAEKWFKKAAKQEQPRALYHMGWFCEKKADYLKAYEWYSRAAAGGHAEAQYKLGEYYSTLTPDKGITKDDEKAAYWFLRAARQEHEEAQDKYEELTGEEPDMDFEVSYNVLTHYSGSDEDITIPDGITEIGENAFRNCRSLINVIIPDGVTHIGKWAFIHCSNVESLTLPDSIKYIGDMAFYNCSPKEIIIPKGPEESRITEMLTKSRRG
jgi:TPR repeat protein